MSSWTWWRWPPVIAPKHSSFGGNGPSSSSRALSSPPQAGFIARRFAKTDSEEAPPVISRAARLRTLPRIHERHRLFFHTAGEMEDLTAIRLITNEQQQARRCVSGFPACRLNSSSRNPKVLSEMAAPAQDLCPSPPPPPALSGGDQESRCCRSLRRLLAASWCAIARNPGHRRNSATAGRCQRTGVANAPG